MKSEQGRFVARLGVRMLEILRVAIPVFLPALSRLEPTQNEFDPLFLLLLTPKFRHLSLPVSSVLYLIQANHNSRLDTVKDGNS